MIKPNFKFRESLLYAAFFVFLIVLDQASKFAAYHSGFASFLNYLRPVLAKDLFPNYNFAFSLKVPLIFTYLIYLVLLLLLFGLMFKIKNKSSLIWISFLLIFAGALSNIYDRATLGYVRDFIFIFWGNIFNLADLYILFGILGFLRELK